MNLRYLETLIAVADQGSMAAAARHLGLASTTVAEQIASLEREMDATLVERIGRRVSLSEAGNAIIEEARLVVSGARKMQDIAKLGELRGVLRVGAISTALTSFVPQAIHELAQLYPDIELRLKPAATNDLFGMIDADRLDCAITSLPPFPLPKSYSWYPLMEQPLVLLAPASLPGERVEDFAATAPLIRMDPRSWTGQIVTSFMADYDLHFRELFEASAHHMMIMMVARGLGVSILPDTGFAGLDMSQLRKIPVGDRRHMRSIGLLGTGNGRRRLVRVFAEVLKRAALAETAKPAGQRLFRDHSTED